MRMRDEMMSGCSQGCPNQESSECRRRDTREPHDASSQDWGWPLPSSVALGWPAPQRVSPYGHRQAAAGPFLSVCPLCPPAPY